MHFETAVRAWRHAADHHRVRAPRAPGPVIDVLWIVWWRRDAARIDDLKEAAVGKIGGDDRRDFLCQAVLRAKRNDGYRYLLGARADDFYGEGGMCWGSKRPQQEHERHSEDERPGRPENRRPFNKRHVAGLYPSGFRLITP